MLTTVMPYSSALPFFERTDMTAVANGPCCEVFAHCLPGAMGPSDHATPTFLRTTAVLTMNYRLRPARLPLSLLKLHEFQARRPVARPNVRSIALEWQLSGERSVADGSEADPLESAHFAALQGELRHRSRKLRVHAVSGLMRLRRNARRH
jgi:hypothetical protein